MAKSLGLARLPLDLLTLLGHLQSVGSKGGGMCISTTVITACSSSSGVTSNLLSPRLLLSPFSNRTGSFLPVLAAQRGWQRAACSGKEEEVDTGRKAFLPEICCLAYLQFCSVISKWWLLS